MMLAYSCLAALPGLGCTCQSGACLYNHLAARSFSLDRSFSWNLRRMTSSPIVRFALSREVSFQTYDRHIGCLPAKMRTSVQCACAFGTRSAQYMFRKECARFGMEIVSPARYVPVGMIRKAADVHHHHPHTEIYLINRCSCSTS